MKQFLEELEKNQELKAKIEELDKNPASTPKDFIRVAAEYGVELKEEDFQPVSAQGELADDELDAVAGGKTCACVTGGGGVAGESHGTWACALVGYGAGNPEFHKPCYCSAAGGGSDGHI